MQDKTREKYELGFQSIIASAESVAEKLDRKPRVEDFIIATTLRCSQFKRSTVGAILAALRYCIQTIQTERKDGLQMSIPDLPFWVIEATDMELEKVADFLRRTPSDIIDGSEKICREFYQEAVLAGYLGQQEELISSFGSQTGQAASRKAEKVVTHREIMMIDMALSDESIDAAMVSAGPARWVKARAMARIFALSIWATGMRPIEVWDCMMMIPIPEKMDTQEKRDLALKDPRAAIKLKLYMLAEAVNRGPGETIGDIIMKATRLSGAPAFLIIKSAKQTNANKQLRTELRIQVLKDAPWLVLSMLGVAAQLRHHKISDRRKDRTRDKINAILQETVRVDPSFDRDSLSLYTLRHSFATRVKLKFDIATAASLIGHTSKRTTYGYGEQRRTKAVSRSGSAQDPAMWTPQADPVHADLISKAWGITAEMDLEHDATPDA
jgi:hypothetical protein